MALNYSTFVLGAVAIGVLIARCWGMPWTGWRVAGLLLLVPSVLLLGLARVQLGRAFSIQAKAEMLVTSGLYARIRNPIYVFGGLTLAGAALYAAQPWLLLLVFLWAPLQYTRSRSEERVLEARFGEVYRDYKRKTWF